MIEEDVEMYIMLFKDQEEGKLRGKMWQLNNSPRKLKNKAVLDFLQHIKPY